jgi:hypothetical protein
VLLPDSPHIRGEFNVKKTILATFAAAVLAAAIVPAYAGPTCYMVSRNQMYCY